MPIRYVVERLEKRVIVIVLLGLPVIAGFGIAASNGFFQSNSGDLVAHYKFEEGGGTTAYDSAGDNDGSLTNFDFDSSSGWTDGKNGKALELDGTNDYVDIPDSSRLDIGTGELTVAAWVSLREDSDGNNWMVIDKGTTQSGTYYLYNDGNNFRMTVKDGSNRYDATASSSIVSQNEWIFLVGRYDESQVELWMNAEKVASASAPADLGSNSEPVWIGHYQGGGYELDGQVDSARIYSRALNQSEIKALYNQGGFRTGGNNESVAGQVLDIGFDRQNSTHVFDRSGNYNHGKPQNGASQETSVHCQVGRCYSFDGSNNRVKVQDSSSLDISRAITEMAWVKPDSCNGHSTVATKQTSYYFQVHSDYTVAVYTYWNDSGSRGSSSYTYSNTALPTGKWSHIAFVENSTGHRKIYIDGVLDKTSSAESSIHTNNKNLGIGYEVADNRPFDGEIDQVQVFDRTLSQQEIIENTRKLDADGAVLDMPLDTTGGDHVEDHSVHDNHGTLKPSGEPSGPNWTDGVQGNALEFDGGDDNVQITNSNSLNISNNIAYSAWVKLHSTVTGSDVQAVIEKGESRKGIELNILGGNLDGQDNEPECVIGDGSNWKQARADISLETDKWYLITCINDGTDNKIYVNGKLEDTTSQSTGVVKNTLDLFV